MVHLLYIHIKLGADRKFRKKTENSIEKGLLMENKTLMENINTQIGKKIRQARLESGLSQLELGHKMHITYQQIQKYEEGRDYISAAKLFMIAKITGRPITFFFGESISEEEQIIMRYNSKCILQISRAWLNIPIKQQDKILGLIKVMGANH